MKCFIVFLFFITFFDLQGQVAIIDDKDGYTNVRSNSDKNSEVIYKLKTNEVFWFGEEDYYSNNVDWILVEIPKNKFSVTSGALDNLFGFVHKSRIKPLNKLKEYKGNDFKFNYVTAPFHENNKIIDFQGKYINSINGLFPWGTDGPKPKLEVKKLNVEINGNLIYIPKILIGDIFECSNDFSIYKIDNTYIVYQWNSDGAGAYEIAWVFNETGVIQRLVGSII